MGVRFVRVAHGEDITILLARPRSVDRLCVPFKTGGWLSCAMMRRANLNFDRWKKGAKTWGDDILGYRSYLINHEVGHLLGLKHFPCEAPGDPAPVMLPQTKFLKGCKANGVPNETEKAALAKTLGRFKTKALKRRARRAKRAQRSKP